MLIKDFCSCYCRATRCLKKVGFFYQSQTYDLSWLAQVAIYFNCVQTVNMWLRRIKLHSSRIWDETQATFQNDMTHAPCIQDVHELPFYHTVKGQTADTPKINHLGLFFTVLIGSRDLTPGTLWSRKHSGREPVDFPILEIRPRPNHPGQRRLPLKVLKWELQVFIR